MPRLAAPTNHESEERQLLLRAIDDYQEFGWHVLLTCRPNLDGIGCLQHGKNCNSVGKALLPGFSGWVDRFMSGVACDYDRIRDAISSHRGLPNLAIAWGKGSNTWDIEIDADENRPEADLERQVLARMQLEMFPPGPIFRSSRGKHRLFKWDDRLNGVAKQVVSEFSNAIGYRIRGVYSVVPPSIHAHGSRYEWMVHPKTEPIPEAAESLVMALLAAKGGLLVASSNQPARPSRQRNEVLVRALEAYRKTGGKIGEGARHETIGTYIGWICRKIGCINDENDVQVAINDVARWASEACDPPLPQDEALKYFEDIFQKECARRRDEMVSRSVAAKVGLGEGRPSALRLEIEVDIDGAETFLFYSPATWEGAIRLDPRKFRLWDYVVNEALAQKLATIGGMFTDREWSRGPADRSAQPAYEVLVANAERVKPPIEISKVSAIARELVYLIRASNWRYESHGAVKEDFPGKFYAIVKENDGGHEVNYYGVFGAIVVYLRKQETIPFELSNNLVIKVMTLCGSTPERVRIAGGRRLRVWLFNADTIGKLEDLSE